MRSTPLLLSAFYRFSQRKLRPSAHCGLDLGDRAPCPRRPDARHSSQRGSKPLKVFVPEGAELGDPVICQGRQPVGRSWRRGTCSGKSRTRQAFTCAASRGRTYRPRAGRQGGRPHERTLPAGWLKRRRRNRRRRQDGSRYARTKSNDQAAFDQGSVSRSFFDDWTVLQSPGAGGADRRRRKHHHNLIGSNSHRAVIILIFTEPFWVRTRSPGPTMAPLSTGTKPSPRLMETAPSTLERVAAWVLFWTLSCHQAPGRCSQ